MNKSPFSRFVDRIRSANALIQTLSKQMDDYFIKQFMRIRVFKQKNHRDFFRILRFLVSKKKEQNFKDRAISQLCQLAIRNLSLKHNMNRKNKWTIEQLTTKLQYWHEEMGVPKIIQLFKKQAAQHPTLFLDPQKGVIKQYIDTRQRPNQQRPSTLRQRIELKEKSDKIKLQQTRQVKQLIQDCFQSGLIDKSFQEVGKEKLEDIKQTFQLVKIICFNRIEDYEEDYQDELFSQLKLMDIN